MLGAIGSAMEGFGRGKMWRDDMNMRKEELALRQSERQQQRDDIREDRDWQRESRDFMREDRAAIAEGRSIERAAPSPGYAAPPSSGGGGASPARLKVADPVNTNLPPYARAFLNAISVGESAGAYNIRYTPGGGATFEMNDRHPRIFEKGPAGPSSAAGRYQFTATTWDDIAGRDTPFTAANQDQFAWELAKRDYRRKTGGDLDAELRAGNISDRTLAALGTTWAALEQPGQRGKYLATYHDSMKRYSAPPPAASPAAAKPADEPMPINASELVGRSIDTGKAIAGEIIKRMKG